MVAVRKFFNELAEQSRLVAVIIGIFFLVGLASAIYMNHREAKSGEAMNSLFLARQTMEQELVSIAASTVSPAAASTQTGSKTNAQADAQKAAPAAPANPESISHKKLDVDVQLPGAVRSFKGVIDKFGGTRAAFEAQLALGDMYYDHGEPSKSVTWYQSAAESAPSTFDKTLAHYALGHSFEDVGKYQDAIQTYEKAVNLGEAGLKGDLLLSVARCYELTHDNAKARSTYDQILSQIPNTDYAKTAELRKTQIQ